MSYCRWLDGDCYVYESCDGGWEVLVANAERVEGVDVCNNFDSPGEAAAFMRHLESKGFDVQEYAVEALELEQQEMDKSGDEQ